MEKAVRLEEERQAREHAAFVATSFSPAANFHSLMRACVRAHGCVAVKVTQVVH